MLSGTGLCQGSGSQWRRVQGLDEYALASVALDKFVSVI